MTIEASDGVNTAIALVTVTVYDANEAPVFDQQSYATELAEDAVSGTKVIGVSAMDEDYQDNQINYAITGGNSDNLFTIDTATGIITLIGTLDTESTTTHILTVEASSGHSDAPHRSKSATTTVTVKVLDAINLAPVFDVALYTPTIAKDAAIGSFVTWVHAKNFTDDTLTYSIIGVNSNELFAIEDHNGISGRITLKGALDYESATTYTLTVQVSDGSNTATTQVVISVEDVNEHSPTFASDAVAWETAFADGAVLENTSTGTKLATITATDVDDTASLSYSLLGDAGPFALSKSGVLTLNGALDYETTPTYTLTVQASDGTNTPTTQVVISVEDVNEHRPVFASDAVAWETAFADGAVLENTSTGTKLATITATDADGTASLSYKLLGDAGSFALSKSGVLTLNGALDYETTSTYTLTVQASDGINTPTTQVVISVEDVNEHRPVFASDAVAWETAFADGAVLENTSTGTKLATITATDADGTASLSYKLLGDAGPFALSKSGVLTLNGALDFETTPTYTLTVQASDGTNTPTTQVVISVEDVNEHRPVFASDAVAWETAFADGAVLENTSTGTKLATITATDADGTASLSYKLLGDAGPFALSKSGVLTLNGALDYETTSTYTLTVQASDGINTPTTQVVISVEDVNEHRPVFASDAVAWETAFADGAVLENTSTGTKLATITATDADGTASLSYKLLGDAGPFALSKSGVLTLNGALDFETTPTHTLTVQASDGTNTPTTQVVISVEDVNEHSPVFASDAVAWETAFADGAVLENTSTGTKLATITATDADGTASLSYKLLGDAGSFALSKSGVLTLNGALDFETTSTYTLTVQASDGTNNTTKNITISVDDVSEITISGSNADNTDSDLANLAVGWTLTARVQTPNSDDVDASTLSYRWFYANNPDGNIGTGTTYKVKGADKGEYIGVELSYTDGAGAAAKVVTKLATVVPRTVIKPEPDTTSGETEAAAAERDNVISVPADQASHVQTGNGADKITGGDRNDVIDGGIGDDEIDLGANKEDQDEIIYGIGNQLASGGADKITSFVRGRDKFVFQLKQSDINASGMSLSADSGLEQFAAYVTQGTADLRDDQFWVNLNFDLGGDVVTLSGISFHFQDSTFFSGARISMPIVSIEFADAVELDALREMFSTSDAPVVNRQGLVIDLDYLDDILGGDDSVGFEII